MRGDEHARGPVEVDETYWGNVGTQRPGARGGDHKMKLVSLVDRKGEKRTVHIPGTEFASHDSVNRSRDEYVDMIRTWVTTNTWSPASPC